MSADLDRVIDRRNTASLKWEKYRETDILPMWVADMDLPVAEEIQLAMQKRLQHPIYGYTVGTQDAAAVICDMLLREYGWQIEPQWLVWIPGVVPGLWASCAAFGDDGDEAIFNAPIYHHFFSVPGYARKVAKSVPLKRQSSGRWTYDFEALKDAITERSRLMLLCSPHNPTGTLFSREETEKMCQLCEDNDLIIVSDEIHCDLILAEHKQHIPTAIACPRSADLMVTLMSPSKTYNLAGLNCSLAVIPDATMRKQFNEVRHGVLPSVPVMSYEAMIAAYSKAGSWKQAMLELLRRNYAFLRQEIATIDGLEMTPMEATFLAWINTESLPVENSAMFFEQHGVGLSPGSTFGLDKYVRLNFACPISTLKEAVERMRSAVESL